MIKFRAFKGVGLLLFGLIFSESAHATSIPGMPGFGVEPEVAMRFFYRTGRFNLFAEGLSRLELGDVQYRSLLAGTYFRPIPSVKVGAFLIRQSGVRYDSDWRPSAGDPRVFEWAGVNARGETLALFDVSPRVSFSSFNLPQLIGELKVRYRHNFYNFQNTMIVRPGLTYFVFEGGLPLWQFFAQYEMDFPMNFGRATIYERWFYLGALYSVSEKAHLGLRLSWRSMHWGSTDQYFQTFGSHFLVEKQSFNLGFLLVFTLS